MGGNTTKHTFNKKAFRKYRHMSILPGLMLVAIQFMYSFFFSDDSIYNKLGYIIIILLYALLLCVDIYTHWVKRFSAKRSVIISSSGCVVYRKRRAGLTALYDRLAAGYGGHERVMFMVYVVDHVDELIDREKRPFIVKGNISAMRVYADGMTVYDRRQVRRAAITAIFYGSGYIPE